MTHLDIINRALIAAGDSPITSIESTQDSAQTVAAWYTKVWKDIITHRPWSELMKEEALEPIEGEDEFPAVYEFEIPSDCLRPVEYLRSDGKRADDVVRTGNIIRSKWDSITLVYNSSENILPIDYEADDIEVPTYLEECVILKLAMQICFKLTQNVNLQAQLHNRYVLALQEAKIADPRGRHGERLWGTRTYPADTPLTYSED